MHTRFFKRNSVVSSAEAHRWSTCHFRVFAIVFEAGKFSFSHFKKIPIIDVDEAIVDQAGFKVQIHELYEIL